MSVEKINNTPVVRFTQMFLDNICESPKKQFSLTLGNDTYVLTVRKKKEGET